jgi:hypothetical protein
MLYIDPVEEKEVIYKLVALVDDEVVFESDYFDTLELMEDGLSKAEAIVERHLNEPDDEMEEPDND